MADQTPLQSLVACGTKLWLDSVDPKEVAVNRALGATGATSNPIIIGDLIKTGRFDEPMTAFIKEGLDDEALAVAADRHAGSPGPGSLSSRLGIDQRRRRLRQL